MKTSAMKTIRGVVFVALAAMWAIAPPTVEGRAFDGCCMAAYNWCSSVCAGDGGCFTPYCGQIWGWTDAECVNSTYFTGGPVCEY